ncbi:hypothetical protein H5A40_16030 [Pectobacterium brasiliense]|uniref:hypothetical protein n=1 Tax=Pectobacterium brasiliense TaxID=180957 RepID=UPI001969189E|nr:hypothetical protein [Pectobacterium brasiliense]QSD34570.1 hypothetical protein H5A40_16030 [Pectobacterium brasiliense]
MPKRQLNRRLADSGMSKTTLNSIKKTDVNLNRIIMMFSPVRFKNRVFLGKFHFGKRVLGKRCADNDARVRL